MDNLKATGREELIKKIIQKKEFSQLPKKDVEKIFEKFERRETSDEDKVKLSRDLLRKVYSVFASEKLLNLKDKEPEWILRKHISTRERERYYKELYGRIFGNFVTETTIIDLGAGVNGFSYDYFPKGANYFGVEAMGQLVDLMNYYFLKNKINGIAIHESLFELEKIKQIILKTKKPRIIFLFKVIDSLEMVEPNYSKKFLKEILPLGDKVVVSFATKSLRAKRNFKVKRYWFDNFVKENFEILEDFELGQERYIVFAPKGYSSSRK